MTACRSTGFRLGAIGLLAVLLLSARADAALLYDGSLATTPDAQGWIFGRNPIFGNSATQVASGGVTTLDTTPVMSDQAGYFSQLPPLPALPGVPVLDRMAGYTVRFDVHLERESHARPDRAGFDVIVLGSDRLGLELALWTDEVFVLDDDVPAFSHGEGAPFDTTAGLTRFDLCVLGDAYTLSADGRELFGGQLRDYSSFGPPYSWANFLFLGDDTTSASGRASLALVEATPASAPTFRCPADNTGCPIPPAAVTGVLAVRQGGDVTLSWEADPTASGFNVWQVSDRREIDRARLGNVPPAMGVAGCSEPAPAGPGGCTDSGGVDRGSPAPAYYQVRVACDAVSEGP